MNTPNTKLPSARTIIQAIALADGKLKGHELYLSKLQICALCKAWLKAHASKTAAAG